MKVLFDVKHLYYIPQYLPVYKELLANKITCCFLFYTKEHSELNKICEEVIESENLQTHWVQNWNQALKYYEHERAEWIVFGNQVHDIDLLHKKSQTVLMQHGIGPKQCYYDVSQNLTTVRFVEGQQRLNRLLAQYPKGCFIDSGYAKLDPAFNKTIRVIRKTELGLDPNKKTLLYAPTFYPSSIECFTKTFAQDFIDYNIIIKPHFFSLTKKKYRKQKEILEYWAQSSNVYLAKVKEYNILPFMIISDIMISDASSAIFEFAALNKPVVWCDFYKLRWCYRGPLNFRFKQRIDSDIDYFHQFTDRAENFPELKNIVDKIAAQPNQKADQRIKITKQLAGRTDGQCSARIADYLIKNAI